VEVQSILVNQTKRGQASRQVWSTNVNLASEFGLEPAYHRLDLAVYKRGVGAD
jgi:hypothetical protein